MTAKEWAQTAMDTIEQIHGQPEQQKKWLAVLFHDAVKEATKVNCKVHVDASRLVVCNDCMMEAEKKAHAAVREEALDDAAAVAKGFRSCEDEDVVRQIEETILASKEKS